MADKDGAVAQERGVAKYVIGMNVGIDDVANRLGCYLTDRGKQPRAFACAAAGIDHGDGITADDEPGIGGVTLICLAHQIDIADVNVDTRCNLGDGPRCRCLRLLGEASARTQN